MAVKIDKEKCTGCGSCIETCSFDAMTINDGVAFADPELCVECGACIDACPNDAISFP